MPSVYVLPTAVLEEAAPPSRLVGPTEGRARRRDLRLSYRDHERVPALTLPVRRQATGPDRRRRGPRGRPRRAVPTLGRGDEESLEIVREAAERQPGRLEKTLGGPDI